MYLCVCVCVGGSGGRGGDWSWKFWWRIFSVQKWVLAYVFAYLEEIFLVFGGNLLLVHFFSVNAYLFVHDAMVSSQILSK